MGEEEGWGWPPTEAPLYMQKDGHWRHFDNSVNAVSFGFVATAILISMFLVMAIFERFLRPTSSALTPSGGSRHAHDIEAHIGFNGKLCYPSPQISVNAKRVFCIDAWRTYAYLYCPPCSNALSPERITWPPHQYFPYPNCIRSSSANASSSSLRRQLVSEDVENSLHS